jgi:hypothetical protein
MKTSFGILSFFLIYIIAFSVQLQAQSLPVGTPVLEDAYRRAQLLGQVDSSVSFTARPFFPTTALKLKNGFDPDSSLEKKSWDRHYSILKFNKGKGMILLLPITWINQFNSDRPAGLNDGAMIPARGYQTLFSGGIYAQYGHLSIQLRPEFVNAKNDNYQGFPHTLTDPVLADQRWYQYYHYYLNNIDLPDRFGEESYQKTFWGQSSIRLNYGAISFGLSTENLWWGPGMQNSLLMTNSAPGFTHFTLNTVRPVRTTIGSFEGQIISGKLKNSGFTPPEPTRNYNGGPPLYEPKPDDWRYINGMVLSYQPKWVPGLFLGITRSFQVYEMDMGNRRGAVNIGDLLPVFSPLSEKGAGNASDSVKKRDQLSSVFMRWVWLKSHGEVYVEYGRSDNFRDQRDLTVEASYSNAYILGLRKLFPLKSYKDEYIQFNMELTQLEMNPTTRNRGGQSWYLSSVVKDGYTNQGQLLGAGIGPGSNLQTINISWVKSLKSVGIQFERYMHNNDFYYSYIKDIRSHWVDLSAALLAEWDFKNLLLNVKAEGIQSLNYEWVYDSPLPPAYWVAGKDLFNFHLQMGVTYRF